MLEEIVVWRPQTPWYTGRYPQRGKRRPASPQAGEVSYLPISSALKPPNEERRPEKAPCSRLNVKQKKKKKKKKQTKKTKPRSVSDTKCNVSKPPQRGRIRYKADG